MEKFFDSSSTFQGSLQDWMQAARAAGMGGGFDTGAANQGEGKSSTLGWQSKNDEGKDKKAENGPLRFIPTQLAKDGTTVLPKEQTHTGNIYEYQLSTADGRRVSGVGYTVLEKLKATAGKDVQDKQMKERALQSNGIFPDSVGIRNMPSRSGKDVTSTVRQTFEVKHNGQPVPVSTVIGHDVRVTPDGVQVRVLGYQTMSVSCRLIGLSQYLLFGGMFFLCELVSARGSANGETDLWNLSVRNQDLFLQSFGPALKGMGGGARLYIRSKCSGTSGDVLFFPHIEAKAPAKNKIDLAAIKLALEKNKDVTVAQRESGLIGMWVGDANNRLLETKLHSITFKPLERYNFQEAVAAITGATEVQAKMRDLQMEESPRLYHYPVSYPDPKLPHLPESMTDVTMDEALDRVARVFGVLVIYEECASEGGTHMFSVHAHEL